MPAPRRTPPARFRFADRAEAAGMLSIELIRRGERPDAVLGLPRGGVVVAGEVARRIDAPLGVVTVGKIRTPGRPELAMGAVAVQGARTEVVRTSLAVDDADFAAERDRELTVARQRDTAWNAPILDLDAATVVVVDDGLATGATMLAALGVLRQAGARRLVAAVPVGSPAGVRDLVPLADVVVCVHLPHGFRSVGDHYRDFGEVDDATVRGELARAAWRLL